MEYLKLKAPLYMLAGVVGVLVLIFLAVTSFLPMRRRVFPQYLQFRNWHTMLSIAALLLSIWHVLGAGFYLASWYAAGVFMLIVAGAPLVGYRTRRRGPVPVRVRVVNASDADRQVLAAFIGALMLSGLFSLVRNI